MIEDTLIADATVHGYNWSEANLAAPVGQETNAAGFELHQMLVDDSSYELTKSEFLRDWSAADVGETLFREGPADVICHHGTPIYDFYRDGHSATHKGFELRDRYPNRVLLYGAINPWGSADWRRELEELVEQGVDGVKVYAARYENGQTIPHPLDSRDVGYPFIERCLELGVRVIATHKAIPFGPVDPEPYGVSDIPRVLQDFPDMNFEIVHAGFAFLDETLALADQGNCWFNLEVAFPLINNQPRRFAEFFGAFLAAGALDRLFYSSTLALVHPRPALEAFMDFQMPEDLQKDRGYPEVTDDIRRAVLGENFLKFHGVDLDELRSQLADDEVSAARADGFDAPWSNVRARLADA